ncbi:MAG: hypothetical protein KGL40_13015 [Rhodocyclaceae bacterium]|nr:hypothetical protein [Rhodocyclaceae bacterium]
MAAPAATTAAAAVGTAIVIQDQAPLRAAPRDSAQQQATLWQGDAVEIRGERMDYLQVWDYRRERGGYVRASQLRRIGGAPEDADALMGVVRYLRETAGSEALGIAYAAAWLQAAPASMIKSPSGAEAFDALGNFADRLARRASGNAQMSKAAEATLAAHLEVAARYGIKFSSFERDGRMQICYDGDALRRVLSMPASPEQQARAVIALTRPACINPDLKASEALALDEWRADVLSRVEIIGLSAYLKNRVQMRRASVWSGLAFQYARRDINDGGADSRAAMAAAQRAIAEFAGVVKADLPDDDQSLYNDVAMRVSASRWAAESAKPASAANQPAVQAVAGEPGQTCLLLVDAKHDAKNPLARRCTYGIVWLASATRNREGNALAVAVQTMSGWRELWVAKRGGDGWTFDVLPPAAVNPDVGYVEFAGWVPGGKQILVARESRGDGKYKRSFEVLSLDSLTTQKQASDPALLAAFRSWQDPSWKRQSLSLR